MPLVCTGSVQLNTTVYNHERTEGVYVLYILMSSPAGLDKSAEQPPPNQQQDLFRLMMT